MLELHHPIGALPGVGPKTGDVFHKQGIRTVEDLLYFFPRAWIDATKVSPVSEAKRDTPILCDVRVISVKSGMSHKNRLPYIRAVLADESDTIDAMWFHAPYLKTKLTTGSRHLLYGTVHGWKSGERMLVSPKFMNQAEIIPVYTEIGGLNSEKIRRFISSLLPALEKTQDHLSDDVRTTLGVASILETLQKIHAPQSLQDITVAKARLAFEELMMVAVPSLLAKSQREAEQAVPLSVASDVVNEWVDTLPFHLTNGQSEAVSILLRDIEKTRPMNRLLQGDVGSGKTVVALAGALKTVRAKRQVVWLAPTELLAAQHFSTTQQLLQRHHPDIQVVLWTRTQKIKTGTESPAIKKDLDRADIVIGTHAVLNDSFVFEQLGLLIIDEQHRFGVKQRALLRKLSDRAVHLLSMTATPIPRTMALTLYGDLDISTIREKPLGRKDVVTRVVGDVDRPKAYDFIEKHMQAGHQVYVVCPMIEPTADKEANLFIEKFQSMEEVKAVTQWFSEMQKVFPSRRVGLLHGKMKGVDKEKVMQQFRDGSIDILVSTSVIEVGVDVPNATIMAIESAERFGLATLHQLRGRVGRSDKPSFCFLFPSTREKMENTRLQLLESTNDGFILAQKDLELRGPGELTGLAQSGLPRLRFATFDDLEKIEKIKEVLPELAASEHFREAVDRFWRLYHPE